MYYRFHDKYLGLKFKKDLINVGFKPPMEEFEDSISTSFFITYGGFSYHYLRLNWQYSIEVETGELLLDVNKSSYQKSLKFAKQHFKLLTTLEQEKYVKYTPFKTIIKIKENCGELIVLKGNKYIPHCRSTIAPVTPKDLYEVCITDLKKLNI